MENTPAGDLVREIIGFAARGPAPAMANNDERLVERIAGRHRGAAHFPATQGMSFRPERRLGLVYGELR